MTRKDYIAIAKAVNHTRNIAYEFNATNALINALCDVFRYDNPRFDAAKFRAVCYQGARS